MEAYWHSIPIALLFALLFAFLFVGARYLKKYAPESTLPNVAMIPRGGWQSIERVAAILGILSFALQIGQWAAQWWF